MAARPVARLRRTSDKLEPQEVYGLAVWLAPPSLGGDGSVGLRSNRDRAVWSASTPLAAVGDGGARVVITGRWGLHRPRLSRVAKKAAGAFIDCRAAGSGADPQAIPGRHKPGCRPAAGTRAPGAAVPSRWQALHRIQRSLKVPGCAHLAAPVRHGVIMPIAGFPPLSDPE